MVAVLRALVDALNDLVVGGQSAMLQPEKNIGFPAHRPDVDNLLQPKVVRRDSGINGIRKLNIFFLIRLDHSRGVNASRCAESILSNHRIIRRYRDASRHRNKLAIALQLRQILPIPGRDTHELQVDQHLIHLRVADPLAYA